MPDHELSPEQERVRRLLAEARVEAPMPDDVVARLDRVLARLADEEDDDDAPSLVDLAARRRRKAATLLVAAAAVVAVGVGAGQLLPGAGLSGGDDSAAESAPEPAASATNDGVDQVGPEGAFSPRLGQGGPQRVRPDHFADDVARLRVPAMADATSTAGSAPPPSLVEEGGLSLGSASSQFSGFVCDPAPSWGPGDLVAVRYSGVPAVLAFRPPAGDTQVVDLLECGTAAILRSVTLPAP
jgi:hypothetical protein